MSKTYLELLKENEERANQEFAPAAKEKKSKAKKQDVTETPETVTNPETPNA